MSKEDCQGIVQLMDSGFSFLDAMILLESRKNAEVFKRIKDELTRGEEMISVIKKYCPKIYQDKFYSFISFLPLKDSLALCVKLHKEEEKQRKDIQKELGYPLLMFFATLVGLYLFVQLCFPLLIQLMSDFGTNSQGILEIRNLFLLLLKIVIGLFLILTGALIVMMKKNHQVAAYCWIAKIFNLNILKQHVSCQFARYFYHCSHIGCKTKETLTILSQLERQPLVLFISSIMERSLLKGMPMKNAIQSRYIDEGLSRFMVVAMYSSTMGDMLEKYIHLSEIKMRQKIKIFTKLLQLFTYGSIAIIMIFVYQILILPLSVMSQL